MRYLLLTLTFIANIPQTFAGNNDAACATLGTTAAVIRAESLVRNMPYETESAVRQSQNTRQFVANWIHAVREEVAVNKANGADRKNAEIIQERFDIHRKQMMGTILLYMRELAQHLKREGRDKSLAGQERTPLIHMYNFLEKSYRPDDSNLDIVLSWANITVVKR